MIFTCLRLMTDCQGRDGLFSALALRVYSYKTKQKTIHQGFRKKDPASDVSKFLRILRFQRETNNPQ